MATTREKLKTYFETGKYPTEAQFAELIDSLRHVDENIPMNVIQGLANALNGKAPISLAQTVTDLYNALQSHELGGMTDEEREQLDKLMSAVFPLVVAYGTKNSGTYEYGTSVTPSVAWTAKRDGVDVDCTATVGSGTFEGTMAQNQKSYTGEAQPLTAELKFSASVSEGGQTKSLSAIKWTPSFYRYYGAVNAVPSDYPAAIRALSTKELSTTATLGTTAVAAGKYFLFAVKSDTAVTLKAYLDSPESEVTGCMTGSCQVQQENGYQSNTYYYILVPAGATAWNLKIKNS